ETVRVGARIDVGKLSDRQRVEQLHVTQTPTSTLEDGLGTMGDLPAALPACLPVLDEFVKPRTYPRAPRPSRPAYQLCPQFGVARNVTGLQHRQPCGNVL